MLRLAAKPALSLAFDHPFVDGNKRTAFSGMIQFLAINGYRFVAPNTEAIGEMFADAVSRKFSHEHLAALLVRYVIA